jgi:hypothetical protein
MSKNKQFRHGIFNPSKPEKYKGNRRPVYRSAWELRLMRWFDESDKVLEWSSEPFPIAYFNPVKNKITRYYPDFLVKYVDHSGNIKIELIEVKPYRQTIAPKPSQGKKQSVLLVEIKQYAINCAKWKSAQQFCQERQIVFKILTEKNTNFY